MQNIWILLDCNRIVGKLYVRGLLESVADVPWHNFHILRVSLVCFTTPHSVCRGIVGYAAGAIERHREGLLLDITAGYRQTVCT